MDHEIAGKWPTERAGSEYRFASTKTRPAAKPAAAEVIKGSRPGRGGGGGAVAR